MHTNTILDQIAEAYWWLHDALAQVEEHADAMGRRRRMVRLPAHQLQRVLVELRGILADHPQLGNEAPALASALGELNVEGTEDKWMYVRNKMGCERDRRGPPSVGVSGAALRRLVASLEPLVDLWALGVEESASSSATMSGPSSRHEDDRAMPSPEEDDDE